MMFTTRVPSPGSSIDTSPLNSGILFDNIPLIWGGKQASCRLLICLRSLWARKWACSKFSCNSYLFGWWKFLICHFADLSGIRICNGFVFYIITTGALVVSSIYTCDVSINMPFPEMSTMQFFNRTMMCFTVWLTKQSQISMWCSYSMSWNLHIYDLPHLECSNFVGFLWGFELLEGFCRNWIIWKICWRGSSKKN